MLIDLERVGMNRFQEILQSYKEADPSVTAGKLDAVEGVSQADEEFEASGGVLGSVEEVDSYMPKGDILGEGVMDLSVNSNTEEESTKSELYDAINAAEMRGEEDHWIRTLYRDAPGGSTAYGPVQITKSLMEGYKKNKAKLFDKEELKFMDKFIKQGADFNKHGNNEGKIEGFDSKFDYGGKGDLIQSDEDKRMYERVASKMLDEHLRLAKGDVAEAVALWRGKSEKEDPEYFKIVRDNLT